MEKEKDMPANAENNQIDVVWKYHNHRKLIFDRVKKLQPESILEVGCGIGGNLEWMRDYFPKVKKYGCDLSLIQQTQKLFPDFLIQEGDVKKLPYNDKSIDILIVDMVLYTFSLEGVDTAMRECKRVAKKAVIISDMARDKLKNYIDQSNDFENIDWAAGLPNAKKEERFVFTIIL